MKEKWEWNMECPGSTALWNLETCLQVEKRSRHGEIAAVQRSTPSRCALAPLRLCVEPARIQLNWSQLELIKPKKEFFFAFLLKPCIPNSQPLAQPIPRNGAPERLKKFRSHAERGFLMARPARTFGEALARAQVRSNPVTEPKRSQNPKRPLGITVFPRGYGTFDNARGGVPANCADYRLWPVSAFRFPAFRFWTAVFPSVPTPNGSPVFFTRRADLSRRNAVSPIPRFAVSAGPVVKSHSLLPQLPPVKSWKFAFCASLVAS